VFIISFVCGCEFHQSIVMKAKTYGHYQKIRYCEWQQPWYRFFTGSSSLESSGSNGDFFESSKTWDSQHFVTEFIPLFQLGHQFSAEASCTCPQLPGQSTAKYGNNSSYSSNYRCLEQRGRHISGEAKVHHWYTFYTYSIDSADQCLSYYPVNTKDNKVAKDTISFIFCSVLSSAFSSPTPNSAGQIQYSSSS
jgi:hypothetical protein